MSHTHVLLVTFSTDSNDPHPMSVSKKYFSSIQNEKICKKVMRVRQLKFLENLIFNPRNWQNSGLNGDNKSFLLHYSLVKKYLNHFHRVWHNWFICRWQASVEISIKHHYSWLIKRINLVFKTTSKIMYSLMSFEADFRKSVNLSLLEYYCEIGTRNYFKERSTKELWKCLFCIHVELAKSAKFLHLFCRTLCAEPK